MAFKKAETTVVVEPLRMEEIQVKIVGTSPYVQNKFSAKAREKMHATQAAGAAGKANRKKEARDFDESYLGAQHISDDGWHGIPAPAFRSAMIDACRTVGIAMTKAKMTIFVVADGLDKDDGTPLVKIEGEVEKHEGTVRNQSGVCDIRVRPMWRHWSANLRIRYDSEAMRPEYVVNLLQRAGQQVGIGEGRPFSKESAGCGWGTFTIESQAEKE